MGMVDVLLMIAIIAGAVLILYQSLWKKQGHCHGCDAGACEERVLKKGTGCH